MWWLDGITDSLDTNLSKCQEITNNRGAWHAAVHGVSKNWTQLSDWIIITTTGARPTVIPNSNFQSIRLCHLLRVSHLLTDRFPQGDNHSSSQASALPRLQPVLNYILYTIWKTNLCATWFSVHFSVCSSCIPASFGSRHQHVFFHWVLPLIVASWLLCPFLQVINWGLQMSVSDTLLISDKSVRTWVTVTPPWLIWWMARQVAPPAPSFPLRLCGRSKMGHILID